MKDKGMLPMKPFMNPINQPKPNRMDNFRTSDVMMIFLRDETLLFPVERTLLLSFCLERSLWIVNVVRMTLAFNIIIIGSTKANRLGQNLAMKHLPWSPYPEKFSLGIPIATHTTIIMELTITTAIEYFLNSLFLE